MSKLQPFGGKNFKPCSERLLFYLRSIKVDYVLINDQVPENVDPTGNYAVDNHTCRGHILHHMNDTLFDLCRTYESAR